MKIFKKLEQHPPVIVGLALAILLFSTRNLWVSALLSPSDCCLLGGGLLLLVRHKTTWLLAIFSFATASVLSSWYFVSVTDWPRVFNLTLSLVSISIVLFFFRYPYIERRQRWFGFAARRYSLTTEVYLKGKAFQTSDLSMVGMSVLKSQDDHFDIEEELTVDIPAAGLSDIKAQVVNVSSKKIHFKFIFADVAYKKILQKWLDTRNV